MKVIKVSTRPVFVPEETPAGEFSKPVTESVLQDSAFFAAQVLGSGPLRMGSAQTKLKLRNKVEGTLNETLKVPQLIDSLTDFLSEVVKEDPQRATLFGI